jgi:hypothetical protein
MDKSLLRAESRKGSRDNKNVPAEKRTGRLREPAACERCGAIFSHRSWRRGHRVTKALLDRASWTQCPACKQASAGEYCGRVLIRGRYAVDHETLIRQRLANVDAQAQLTQPERRLVSVERNGAVFEALTTSQKLAHRIVHELKKAFHGRASYKWSDDGSLFAVWERD